MSRTVGRAGGNVRHIQHRGTKGLGSTRADRASILHESMRELDEEAVKIHARRNPNIVATDSHLNVAMVNNGDGSFRTPTSTSEVLDYGDARINRVYRKWNDNSFETTLIAAHLPKTMCREVPNFYPVIDGETGEPVLDDESGEQKTRSRWVARDRDEAIEYFDEVLAYYSSQVLTGGADAIHGYDINFDESTPHIQIMADTLAPDPKHDGMLRVDAARMWGYHRDVQVDKINAETGQPALDKAGQPVRVPEQASAKMSRYQRGLREHMIAKGYPVEADYDPERHLSGLGKDEYAEALDNRRQVEDQVKALKIRTQNLEHREAYVSDYHVRVDDYREKIAARDAWLNEAFEIVDAERTRIAAHQGALEEKNLELELQRQQVAERLSAANIELEHVTRTRTAVLRQQEVLKEREAQVAARERVISDVNTFLDSMKNPAGEALRQKFDRFMQAQKVRHKRTDSARRYGASPTRSWDDLPSSPSDHQLGA